MINYNEFTLDNGLKVLVHEDKEVEQAVVNILYDVGSRDEAEDKTGFAHLFEHLMFGGSKNIPSYDEPLQFVGGDNNAFTSPDITNYYATLPASNLETAFWLESDRMLSLSFDPKVLEVQKNVVVEEFKQRYLNQPYGDVWLKLRPLAYKRHPYQWPTIGKEISHIEKATMDDVKSFFFSYYIPANAVMVVAGNVDTDHVYKLTHKWFGEIPQRPKPGKKLPMEEPQNEKRFIEVESDVPLDSIYKVFHMPGRFDGRYYTADLLSDILGRGHSSRLYNNLVKGKKIFNDINSYVMGSVDPGLLVISGKLNRDQSMENAEKAIDETLMNIMDNGIRQEEVDKVKNQAESTFLFSEVEVLHRAMYLAFGNLSGDPDWVNHEVSRIREVTVQSIKEIAGKILQPENSSVMYYKSHRQ